MRRNVCSIILIAAFLSSFALLAQQPQPAPAAPAAPAEKTIPELISAGEYQAAVDKGNKVIEAGAADYHLYILMGAAHFNLKDYPKAIEMYEKATVLDSSKTQPYEKLAGVYYATGQFDKGVEALNKAAVIDPAKATLLTNYSFDAGAALYKKGEYEKAEPLLRKAVEGLPEDFDINLAFAQCLQRLKRHADAIPYFQKLLALNTDEAKKPAFLLKLAECQYFGKQFADAVTTSEQILVIRPNEERALMFRASSYLELKDCAKAVPAVESFLAVSKNDVARLPMIKGMARCYYDQKKFKEAAATYEQAFALDGNDEDVLLYGGNSFIQTKQNPKALAYFKKLVSVTKDATLKASAQKNVRQLGG